MNIWVFTCAKHSQCYKDLTPFLACTSSSCPVCNILHGNEALDLRPPRLMGFCPHTAGDSKCSPKRPKASLYSSGDFSSIESLEGSLWGTDTAKGSGLDQTHLFFNPCRKFLHISRLRAARETVPMGEGEHQCSCFRAVFCQLCAVHVLISHVHHPVDAPGGGPRQARQVLCPWASAHTSALCSTNTTAAPPWLLRLLTIQATRNFPSTAAFFY